jgi:hypothetical protein
MSNLGKLVAARHLDGTLHKGRTADFKPGCASFHLRKEDGTVVCIETNRLKAVFFIKTLEGDPTHEEVKDFTTKTTPEKKIWILFADGEALAGWSSAFASGKGGFYLTPTDPDSNLERAYAYHAAIRLILQGEEAEKAAEAYRAKIRMG